MRGKGLLEGEVLTLFRDNWEMSSHKARLDVGFGGIVNPEGKLGL